MFLEVDCIAKPVTMKCLIVPLSISSPVRTICLVVVDQSHLKNLDLCVCLPVCICLCTPKYIHPHHSLYDFTYKFRSTRSALKSTTFSSKYFCFYFTQLQKRLLVRGVKKWLWKFVLFGMKFFLCYATIQTPLDCMILLGLTMKLKICFCQSLLMIQFRG